MSTLSLRAIHMPHLRLKPFFARVQLAFTAVMDVLVEARQLERAAHDRYPFAEG